MQADMLYQLYSMYITVKNLPLSVLMSIALLLQYLTYHLTIWLL